MLIAVSYLYLYFVKRSMSESIAGLLKYFKQRSSQKSLRSGHSFEIIQMCHVFDFSNKKHEMIVYNTIMCIHAYKKSSK